MQNVFFFFIKQYDVFNICLDWTKIWHTAPPEFWYEYFWYFLSKYDYCMLNRKVMNGRFSLMLVGIFWNKNILILLFEQYSNFVLSDVNAVSAPRHISAINVVWCWLILLYEYILHNQQLTSSYILQLIKHFSYFCSFTILKFARDEGCHKLYIFYTSDLFSFINFPWTKKKQHHL